MILAAKAGNKTAFSWLVEKYSRRVYRAALSFLHNIEDASDIAQEVFIRAYNNMAAYDPQRPLYPWLYRITRNLCINRLKSSTDRESSLPDVQIPFKGETPELQLIKKEEIRHLRKAIAGLKPSYREILLLKHFQDCSYAEIADILSIPVGTVMSRLYNARMSLRKELLKEDTIA